MTATPPAGTPDDDTTPTATPQPAVQADDFARKWGDSLEWVAGVDD